MAKDGVLLPKVPSEKENENTKKKNDAVKTGYHFIGWCKAGKQDQSLAGCHMDLDHSFKEIKGFRAFGMCAVCIHSLFAKKRMEMLILSFSSGARFRRLDRSDVLWLQGLFFDIGIWKRFPQVSPIPRCSGHHIEELLRIPFCLYTTANFCLRQLQLLVSFERALFCHRWREQP